MTNSVLAKLMSDTEAHEAFRGDKYIDSEGHPTIGIGTKLPLTLVEARMLMRHRMLNGIGVLRDGLKARYNVELETLPEKAQRFLCELSYQIGAKGALAFKNTIAYIKAEKWEKAYHEAHDSLWARQTPNRAKVVAGYLLEGVE